MACDADEGAARIRIPVRGALTQEVGEEVQAVGVDIAAGVGREGGGVGARRVGGQGLGDPLHRCAAGLHRRGRHEAPGHDIVEGEGAAVRIVERRVGGERDPRRRAQAHVGAVFGGDDAGADGRHRAVAPAHHDANLGRQAQGIGGMRGEGAHDRHGVDDLGEERGIEACRVEHGARPGSGELVVGVRAARVGPIGGQAPGETEDDVVLRDAETAHPPPHVGFVVAHPHDLLDRVGGVQPVAEQPVGRLVAEGVAQFAFLCRRARVGPDDRRAHGSPVAVEEHGAHHLAADDEARHLGRLHLGALDERSRRRHDGVPPVAGVLLGDAAGGEVGGVGDGDGCEQAAGVVVERRLVAGRSEIVGDEHGRVTPRTGAARIRPRRGTHAGPCRARGPSRSRAPRRRDRRRGTRRRHRRC